MITRSLYITSLCVLAAIASTAAMGMGMDPTRPAVFSSAAVAAQGAHQGATVLWGGRIFARVDDAAQRCLEVVAYPLDPENGRPKVAAPRWGGGQVFYACSNAQLEWSNYAPGREVAVAGTLGAIQERIVSPADCSSMSPTVWQNFRHSSVKETQAGCVASIPVVAISDSRTWADVPLTYVW